MFSLWLSLCLRAYIAEEVGRCTGPLPNLHDQYERGNSEFLRINEELKLSETPGMPDLLEQLQTE